jgi:hypothetical protein
MSKEILGSDITSLDKAQKPKFSVGDTCHIEGGEGVKEVVVNRDQDANCYYLIDLGDEYIIPALEYQMFHSKNDCIDQQVLYLQKRIENLNSQRISKH